MSASNQSPNHYPQNMAIDGASETGQNAQKSQDLNGQVADVSKCLRMALTMAYDLVIFITD